MSGNGTLFITDHVNHFLLEWAAPPLDNAVKMCEISLLSMATASAEMGPGPQNSLLRFLRARGNVLRGGCCCL